MADEGVAAGQPGEQPAERRTSIDRETSETSVHVELDLDGSGRADVQTGIGFFDHMLTSMATHGRIDLTVTCRGDLEVDAHHTMEDVALAVGAAIDQALGDRAGIVRMADATVPMDEALVQAVVDIAGRPYAATRFDFVGERAGEVPTEMVPHVIQSLAVGARMTVHVRQLAGGNDHHIVEAAMKALGRALAAATRPDPRLAGGVPSTKGTLTT